MARAVSPLVALMWLVLGVASAVPPPVAFGASWRDAVRHAAGAGQCDSAAQRHVDVLIDSEMLGKSGDHMGLLAFAADIQQHRRLQDLPRDLSSKLDDKARGIGKLAQTVMQADLTRDLMRGLR
mmetsp:Transcript_87353/g.267307  ORF Transcript_87353/g.267307 Transcript_87353/m.267307 type:complete len:124 (-) Transcript_87353:4-375(-)